jgi:hypothetical protein
MRKVQWVWAGVVCGNISVHWHEFRREGRGNATSLTESIWDARAGHQGGRRRVPQERKYRQTRRACALVWVGEYDRTTGARIRHNHRCRPIHQQQQLCGKLPANYIPV